MNGVRILNETMVESNTPVGIFGIVILSILFISSAIIIIVAFKYIRIDVIVVGAIMCVLCLLGIVGVIDIIKTPPYKQYEVTISDEVSFKEFSGKYEVIEQRGEIYIVKERE